MKKITDRTPGKALNDNLKEVYIGIDILNRYSNKCKSVKLKTLLKEIISLYEKEALELSNKISLLGESPSTNPGILGKASEVIYNLKTVSADTDSEILEESIKSHKTYIMMFQKFLQDKGEELDKESLNLIKNIIKENELISKKLDEFSKPEQADFF